MSLLLLKLFLLLAVIGCLLCGDRINTAQIKIRNIKIQPHLHYQSHLGICKPEWLLRPQQLRKHRKPCKSLAIYRGVFGDKTLDTRAVLLHNVELCRHRCSVTSTQTHRHNHAVQCIDIDAQDINTFPERIVFQAIYVETIKPWPYGQQSRHAREWKRENWQSPYYLWYQNFANARMTGVWPYPSLANLGTHS